VIQSWSINGFARLIRENALLRVTVLPELSGEVLVPTDKPADRDMLWHNPRLSPNPEPYRTEFDDWLCGAWAEVVPTGDVACVDEEPLPRRGGTTYIG
jgi:hypothetical protein